MDLTKANQPRFQATDSDGKPMWQVYARILPAGLKGGEVLETSDGRKVTATSNEVARLDNLLRQGHDY